MRAEIYVELQRTNQPLPSNNEEWILLVRPGVVKAEDQILNSQA
jgi:hypothetical protein